MEETEIKKLREEFSEKIDLYYFDILFSSEKDANENTKILQRKKQLSNKKIDNNQNNFKEKEIFVEISGLSYVLDSNKDSIIDQ